MTWTLELDLDMIKANRNAKYLGQRSFSSKVIVRTYGHTHAGPIVRPEPLKLVGNNFFQGGRCNESLNISRFQVCWSYSIYCSMIYMPVNRQRGWARHSSQRRAAVRHDSGGKLIGWTGLGAMWNSWTSSDDRLWSVQTTLLAADDIVSGKLPCQRHRLRQSAPSTGSCH